MCPWKRTYRGVANSIQIHKCNGEQLINSDFCPTLLCISVVNNESRNCVMYATECEYRAK